MVGGRQLQGRLRGGCRRRDRSLEGGGGVAGGELTAVACAGWTEDGRLAEAVAVAAAVAASGASLVALLSGGRRLPWWGTLRLCGRPRGGGRRHEDDVLGRPDRGDPGWWDHLSARERWNSPPAFHPLPSFSCALSGGRRPRRSHPRSCGCRRLRGRRQHRLRPSLRLKRRRCRRRRARQLLHPRFWLYLFEFRRGVCGGGAACGRCRWDVGRPVR